MSAPAAASAPLDTARAWETVLRHVEAQLMAGILKPGDHLPAERTLATDLGVGRSSVREAIRVLEVLGLIRTQSGSGPQSGAIIIARPSGAMSALVRLQVAAQGFAVRDVVKTRLVLESAVVAELAADPRADLAPARELLDAMEHPADGALSRDEFLSLDQAFHLALAVASGNEVMASMMGGLRDSIEQYVRVGASHLPSWEATCERLKTEHRGIVGAIADGDAELARSRIRDHIQSYHAETDVAAAHSPVPPTDPAGRVPAER